jgi:diamine N-acetyltransferase
MGGDARVTLREVSAETVRAICALEVRPEQRGFVAPNAVSIAEAHFEPRAWFRAVYADETPVGFVMLYDDPEKGWYYLWRFMIAGEHQGKGFGKRALDLVVEHVRARPGAMHLLASYVPGDGSPGPFYLRYGFVETGKVEHGETEIRLGLEPAGAADSGGQPDAELPS